jgi:hypothetical protein
MRGRVGPDETVLTILAAKLSFTLWSWLLRLSLRVLEALPS